MDMENTMSIDESILFEAGENNMEAYVLFVPAQNGGKALSFNEINSFIYEKGVRYGIDKIKILTIAKRREPEKLYLIAKGKQPINGRDGSIEFLFDISKNDLRPKVKEDNTVDLRDLNIMETAEVDQLLAKAIEPTVGKNGIDIFGNVAEAKDGKPHPAMPMGKNTYIDDDGKTLKAKESGQILYIDRRVSVNKVFEIQGEVGVNTGNINFSGSVVVHGDVRGDYQITAEGNVEIYGAVEGAKIVSGGNILIQNGLFGADKADVFARGNITAKLINNAKVVCMGNIFADGILHSNVICNKRIELLSRRGMIIGGKTIAKQGIIAKTIGSSMGIGTEISVGLDLELNDKIKDAKKEMKSMQEKLYEYNKFIKSISSDKRNVANLTEKSRATYLKTIKAYQQIKEEINKLHDSILHMETEMTAIKQKGMVYAQKTIHPSVKLYVGNSFREVKKPIESCLLSNVGIGIKEEYCDLNTARKRMEQLS